MMPTLLIRPSAIRALSPCSGRWAVYRAAHPGEDAHPFVSVLDSNGLDDALWVLDRLPGPIALRLRLLVAAAYADRVLPLWLAAYPEDDRPAAAIRAARAWADAIGTEQEPLARASAAAARDAAGASAWAAWAAGDAAGDAAAWDAAWAAWAAGDAAWDAAAWDAAWVAAWAAGDAAWDAARGYTPEREAQARVLREIIASEEVRNAC